MISLLMLGALILFLDKIFILYDRFKDRLHEIIRFGIVGGGATVTHINGTALVFNPADANYSQAIDLGSGVIKVKAAPMGAAARAETSASGWRHTRVPREAIAITV